MKKKLLSLLLLTSISGAIYAETNNMKLNSTKVTKNGRTNNLVSIDSLTLMQKSKEGKQLSDKLQKEIENFQKEVKEAQQKVVDLQEALKKQASVLSSQALSEKSEELSTTKKRAERDLADREEVLKSKIQREQTSLRNKQLKTAQKVFDEKDWGMMIDKNTPGVLFVNKAIDKTDEVLKMVDSEYDKQTAKDIVSSNKKA